MTAAMRPRKASKPDGKRAGRRIALSFTLLLALAPAFCVHAEVTPNPGSTDGRLKWVNYNPDDVVKVVARFGYATEIRFDTGENVTQVIIGDSSTVKTAPVGNRLFLKPKLAEESTTNVTVLTDKGRDYNFALTVLPPGSKSKDGLYFSVAFHYPGEKKSLAASAVAAAKLKNDLAHPIRRIKNTDYFACGDSSITPDQAFDDGRFTYLRFAGARQIPAIYAVAEDGSEQIVNSSADVDSPDTVVVQRLAKRMVFRLGGKVGCLVNKDYTPRGIDTFNGTVAPSVERVVKGASQ